MDIVEACKKIITEKLEEIERDENGSDSVDPQQTQLGSTTSAFESTLATEKDKNLDKILNQQAHLKRIIDQDSHIQMLKSSLIRVSTDVENLRKECTRINEQVLKSRQELVEAHAKEIDKLQMAQMRFIAEDYDRHQQILELRKRDIQSLKREIEREEKDRAAYLADVEKKLDKQIQDRQKALRGGGLPFTSSLGNTDGDFTDELNNPDHIELTSVDEYAPYGAAPHSRIRGTGRTSSGRGGIAATTATKSGGGGGRGRGRRRRG